MIPLQHLLLLLGLSLPFEPAWADDVTVVFAEHQQQIGWLGYACYDDPPQFTGCSGLSSPSMVLLPALGTDRALLRTVVAHEAYHLYFKKSHGTPDDPYDERGAYAFGCLVEYVPLCNWWLRSRSAP